jgi:hypothetical protein
MKEPSEKRKRTLTLQERAIRNLEQEADELAAIFATIIIKMERRLADDKAASRRGKRGS